MATNTLVSHALREYIHPNALEPLNGFVLVKVPQASSDKIKSYYFCFGRHDFFLVPRAGAAAAAAAQGSSSSSMNQRRLSIGSAAQQLLQTHHQRKILVVSYRAVEKIFKCVDQAEICTIGFTPGTIVRYKHDSAAAATAAATVLLEPLQLICSERERLLTELLVGIKASHMFLTFEVHTKELVEEYYAPKEPTMVQVGSGRNKRQTAAQAAASAQFIAQSFQGYTFSRPVDYEEVPRPGLLKKQFDKPVRAGTGGGEVQFEIGKVSSNPFAKLDASSLHLEVSHTNSTGGETLQTMAERAARAICAQVEDWRLVQRPSALPKRCLNDPSLWTCWSMKFRTLKSTSRAREFRLVTLIACRRSFIPPSMTQSCDFIITHFSQYNDLEGAVSGVDVAERVLESLQPEAKTFDRDDLVIQTTLDTLLLDPPAWRWLDQTVKLRPSVHDTLMRKFCRTLVEFLLEAENAHSVWTPAQKIQNVSLMNAWDAQAQNQPQQLQPMQRYAAAVQAATRRYTTTTASAPSNGEGDGEMGTGASNHYQTEDEVMIATLMNIANQMENQPPALDVSNMAMADEDTKRDWAAWKLRVWRYLAYCVDGAVYHQVLDFELLTKVWKAGNTKPGLKRTVGVVLDRCINLNNDHTSTLAELCAQSINAPELTFNVSALGKLLETGYVQACLSERDPTLFSKFLVRLLFCEDARDGGAGVEPISHAVLKSLVSFSLDEDHEANLNLLVPALIRVFMMHGEDDKLRTWCVGILVNFSRNNNAVKSNILAGGGFVREMIQLLRSKDDDLVRHACSLLVNLAKTSSEFRQSLYRSNLKQCLMDLIKRTTMLSNVLQSKDLFRSPKIIALACQLLGHLAIEEDIRRQLLEGDETQNDSDGLFRIPALVRVLADLVCKESAHLGEEVRFAGLFALKNLSIGGGNNVKSSLGRYSSKDFIKILRDKDVKDALVMDYLLRVIYSLCFDLKISSKLVSEKLLDGLALRKQDFPNICLQIKAKIEANQQVLQQQLQQGKQAVARGSVAEEEENGEEEEAMQQQQAVAGGAGSITGGILRASRSSRSSLLGRGRGGSAG